MYEKSQATEEFTRWSRELRSLDPAMVAVWAVAPGLDPTDHECRRRSVRQASRRRLWHRGICRASSRVRFPKINVWGIDLVPDMLAKGRRRWRRHSTDMSRPVARG